MVLSLEQQHGRIQQGVCPLPLVEAEQLVTSFPQPVRRPGPTHAVGRTNEEE